MTDNANYPKRLIEVDLPIKRISAHARREKSIRHGHISTLHIWWARRPLAACRAVICAALWPDPADPLCPESFRERAKELMRLWAKDNLKLVSQESFTQFTEIQKNPDKLNDNKRLRTALLDFIADFANWDNSTNKEYLETSRALTQSAHEALGGEPGTRPLVVDPFAGGGAIPLEALRLGADTFCADINDIPVVINKLMLEALPTSLPTLEEEYRKLAEILRINVEKRLSNLFPIDEKDSVPFVYFWSRTIKCEGPNCGRLIPLIGNPYLSKRPDINGTILLKYDEKLKPYICLSKYADTTAQRNVKGGSVVCSCTHTTPTESVRRQLTEQSGGADESLMIAVGIIDKKDKRKNYRLPTEGDLKSVDLAKTIRKEMEDINDSSKLFIYPNEKLWGKAKMNVGLYGITTWDQVFTSRQLIQLRVFQEELRNLIFNSEQNISKIATTLLVITINKLVDYSTSLCRWVPSGEFIAATIGGEKKLPMMWDFAEVVLFGNGPGSWSSMVDWVARFIDHFSHSLIKERGIVVQSDARQILLPTDSAHVIFTDPPYYDAIWYCDLSDMFSVWLRRTLEMIRSPIEYNSFHIKEAELIKSTFSEKDGLPKKDDNFYEKGMAESFKNLREYLQPSGIGVVVFAHKSTKGWEAILSSLIDAGFVITSAWPIDTEREARMTSLGQAALGSSVHIVCRPRRKEKLEVGDWRDVLQELPKRIHEWMPRLASEGVVGADAIFACLGPALEIFSRYSRVEKASGEEVKLKDYLEHVWAAVAKEALNMIFTDADVTEFEEDARLTAMWLWTLTAGATGSNNATEEDLDEPENEDDESDNTPAKPTGFILEFDAARKIAQGLGAHLENLTSLIEIKKDKARLLPVFERSRYLFGKQEEKSSEKGKKRTKKDEQLAFNFLDNEVLSSTTKDDKFQAKQGTTVLDRIHQSMLLFSAGRSEALKRFLVEDGVGQDQRFWRLAQALSALYPTGTDEKRWVDGVLARKKGLGF